MINKNQNNQIKLEDESPATKHLESLKQSNQVHQIYQPRRHNENGNSDSSGNSGRGWRNFFRDIKNGTITPSQAFVVEYEELSRAIFDMVDSYQEERFEEAIKQISNYVGTKFDNSISIHYVVLKLKNLCWILHPTMMRALTPRPRSGYRKRKSI